MHPRRTRLRASIPAVLTSVASAVALATLSPGSPAASGAPAADAQRMIVLLDAAPALDPAATDGPTALRAGQQRVLAAARDAGLDVQRRGGSVDLVNAVAVEVAPGDESALAALPGVADVVPDRVLRTTTDVSVPLVGAPEVWERSDPSGVKVRGDGITVAVLDSGVDYTNPSLGGAFGEGHKVVAGHDFVNDDSDPMDDNGHGTHVAGIIAGQGAVTGVAPGASLTAYKVMGKNGTGFESDIIAGLEAAVDPANPHRADVVNLSLGGPGDGTDPLGRAATAAVDLGVVVVASAGNAGPGANTVGSPARADGVVSVGASTSGIREPRASVVSPHEHPLQIRRAPFSANPPAEPVTGALVDVGLGTDADYARVGDVAGKVVAYRARIPGDVTGVSPSLIAQAKRAEDRGALAVVAYESSSGPVLAEEPSAEHGADGSGDSFRMDEIVVMALLDTQWDELTRYLAEGPVEISVSGVDVTDQVAPFSSRGPTDSFALEPDLVAPGVEIRSTWPLKQWAKGVFRLSGTSMSAPHVAGAAALVRQLRRDLPARRVGSQLIGSAQPADDAPPSAQGAGRLDVAAAATTGLSASPSSVSFGLADMSSSTVSGAKSVRLHNDGAAAVALSLSTERADGSVGTATVSPTSVTVPAGGQADVTVRVEGERPDGDSDLSGWVVANPTGDAPALRVPYLLAVRTLVVQASPDPSDGTSEVFVFSPLPASAPPVVTVTPPHGKPFDVTTRRDHGEWYRASIEGAKVGAHRVDASAWASTGQRLVGGGGFEVVPPDNRLGGARWEPVGPNSQGGTMAMTPADDDVLAMTVQRSAPPWISDDGGETWQQRGRLPVGAGTGSLVVDAERPERMWYAVSGSSGWPSFELLDPTYQGRVLRTDDAGKTWQTLDVPDVHITALVSDPGTEVLAAVTTDAVLVSGDDGDSWTSVAHPAV
ncbi:MAG: S8 family serine peptidase, partial [Nocardioidaceae bacterium]